MIATLLAIALVGGVLAGPILSQVESPNYNVLNTSDNIEIRQYPPLILATVTTQGEREAAIGDGFRILADYIFGKNTTAVNGLGAGTTGQTIAMTAPVQQQEISQSIAMTAPVQQQGAGNTWQISFVMPAQYTLQTLPKPIDARIRIEQTQPKQTIAIRFTGRNTPENIQRHETALLQYIEQNKIETTGLPVYAFYNPPITLPILRRNEIMLDIKTP